MSSNYKMINIFAIELKATILINKHNLEQCCMFSKAEIEKTINMIDNEIISPITPTGYFDEEQQKLILVRYPNIFNHLLALYYPNEMEIDPKRTNVKINNDLNINFNLFVSPNYKELKQFNLEKDSLKIFKEKSEKITNYSFPVIVYNTKELALLACSLN